MVGPIDAMRAGGLSPACVVPGPDKAKCSLKIGVLNSASEGAKYTIHQCATPAYSVYPRGIINTRLTLMRGGTQRMPHPVHHPPRPLLVRITQRLRGVGSERLRPVRLVHLERFQVHACAPQYSRQRIAVLIAREVEQPGRCACEVVDDVLRELLGRPRRARAADVPLSGRVVRAPAVEVTDSEEGPRSRLADGIERYGRPVFCARPISRSQ